MFENVDHMTPDVCRACLTNADVDMKSLFDNNLYEKYSNCTSLEILQDDALPQNLCAKCTNFVLQWSEFKRQCQQSEFLLLKHSGKIEVLEEEPDLDKNYSNLVRLNSEKDVKSEISDYPDKSEHSFDEADNVIIDSDDKIRQMEYGSEKPTYTLTKKCKNTIRNNVGKCSNCRKIFVYNKALRRHLETCGRDGKPVRVCARKKKLPKLDTLFCGICSIKCENLTNLDRHLNNHQESGNLTCQVCGKIAADFAELVCHRYEHQRKGYRLMMHCFLCSRRFSKKDRLEFHFRGIHLNKTPGLCVVCGKSFLDIKYFNFHKLLHTGKILECDKCHKSFTNRRSLINHLKCHSDRKEYICDLCGFACKLPTGLASHQFRKHSDNQPMPCKHCGKNYKNKETLREHLLRVTSERNYACRHCGKKFRTEKELAYHEKWHSDTKAFVCAQCGKSYKRRAHLKAHTYQHSGERPFECNICFNSFMTSNVLKMHMMTHTGERPFSCQHCEKRFIKKSNLQNHLKTHKDFRKTIRC